MKLRDDCEDRLFQLIGKPTYIILASEAGYESTSAEYGDTGMYYDCFFKHTITEDRWRGRGAGMVIHAESLSWEASRLRSSGVHQMGGELGFLHSPTMSLGRFESLFWGIVLHESAHVVSMGMFSSQSIIGLDEPAKVEIVERWKETRAAEAKSPPKVAFPWLDGGDHGPRYVRAAAHLCWRAVQRGYSDFGFCDVLPTRYFHGLDSKLFRSALSRECRERAAEPIETILDSPLPSNYQRVWGMLSGK